MLYDASHNETGLAGAQVCGSALYPADGDSVYAVIRMPNMSCGITVEAGNGKPYLRFTPAIQVPAAGREGFERFQFECDDEEMVDLKFDPKDGEVVLRRPLSGLSVPEVERVLKPTMAWLNAIVYPQVMGYIEGAYAKREA